MSIKYKVGGVYKTRKGIRVECQWTNDIQAVVRRPLEDGGDRGFCYYVNSIGVNLSHHQKDPGSWDLMDDAEEAKRFVVHAPALIVTIHGKPCISINLYPSAVEATKDHRENFVRWPAYENPNWPICEVSQ